MKGGWAMRGAKVAAGEGGRPAGSPAGRVRWGGRGGGRGAAVGVRVQGLGAHIRTGSNGTAKRYRPKGEDDVCIRASGHQAIMGIMGIMAFGQRGDALIVGRSARLGS